MRSRAAPSKLAFVLWIFVPILQIGLYRWWDGMHSPVMVDGAAARDRVMIQPVTVVAP
jgi:hypothetical protein